MAVRRALVFITLGTLLIVLSAMLLASNAAASPALQESPTPVQPNESTPAARPNLLIPTPQSKLSISDEVCLSCHGLPGQVLKLENGEDLDLFVSAEFHQGSVHGEMGYACVQCHTDVGDYPHPVFEAANRRTVTLELNKVCARCHTMQFELSQDSVHEAAQTAGNLEAAVCVDCHTAHEVRRLNDPETNRLLPDAHTWIPERCALCHNAIYQKYSESVHGAALSEGNPDVPTCIDCHGVHNISNPTTSYFRLKSPDICARCHTDPKIMSQYKLSTEVLETYVSDFHGTTVAIFEKQSPDADVNKPVCYDCHGVHDISRVDDPETGLEMKQNLLSRCQECHPDANDNFPTAWMSHYIPSPENYPLVYYVNLFYKYFIPFTLGGMALLVVMDAGRSLLNRSRRRTALLKEMTAEGKAETAPTEPIIQPETEIEEMEKFTINDLDEINLNEPEDLDQKDEEVKSDNDSNQTEAENG